MTLCGHHCILRTGELLEVRRSDIHAYGAGMRLKLRDTKVGGRIGVDEWTSVTDPFLQLCFTAAYRDLKPGDSLCGLAPHAYRKLWRQCCNKLGLAKTVQPYGLRRGGATAYFAICGSFDKTADRGRWRNVSTL